MGCWIHHQRFGMFSILCCNNTKHNFVIERNRMTVLVIRRCLEVQCERLGCSEYALSIFRELIRSRCTALALADVGGCNIGLNWESLTPSLPCAGKTERGSRSGEELGLLWNTAEPAVVVPHYSLIEMGHCWRKKKAINTRYEPAC